MSGPGQMDERLLAVAERARRTGTLERIELGPVTQHEAHEPVDAILAGEDAGRLYHDAGGNPFYLEQLARSSGRAGTSAGRPASAGMPIGGIDVPPAVEAALGEELALLSEGARLVLEGASIAGDPFDPALLNGVGDRFDAAGAREFAGRACPEAGDSHRATELLREAAVAYDSFGSMRYLDEIELDLRRLGHRTPTRRQPRTGDGLAALSALELEVARLVVERKTDPEIAVELFLSPKAVETHLRNAFRKLDVSSRVELARAVERAEQA